MKKVIFIISVIFILSGLMLLNYNMFLNKSQQEMEKESIMNFFDNYEMENTNEEREEQVNVNNYLAVIEIPAISLKTGVIMGNSNYSSMNKNVSIFPKSDMPNEKNGNFILFAHRGNSRVSYFKDIYKLENGEKIYIYYSNEKYTYKVIKKYDVSMYDNTPLNKMTDKTIITLITCKKGNKDYRTIIVGELVK